MVGRGHACVHPARRLFVRLCRFGVQNFYRLEPL